MKNITRSLLLETSGATAIEYGLVATLISLVFTGGATALGYELGDTFAYINTALRFRGLPAGSSSH